MGYYLTPVPPSDGKPVGARKAHRHGSGAGGAKEGGRRRRKGGGGEVSVDKEERRAIAGQRRERGRFVLTGATATLYIYLV